MLKIAIVVDVSNLYYCVKKKYDSKVDYKALREFINPMGKVVKALAFGAQLNDEARGFIEALKHAGYEPKFKKPKQYTTDTGIRRKADWDVSIALELLELAKEVDLIVLGCADGDLAPAVKQVIDAGCRVLIIGAGISGELSSIADTIEIVPSMLEKS